MELLQIKCPTCHSAVLQGQRNGDMRGDVLTARPHRYCTDQRADRYELPHRVAEGSPVHVCSSCPCMEGSHVIPNPIRGLHNDARNNGHSLSKHCHGVVFGL
jgi:hypothetical protein